MHRDEFEPEPGQGPAHPRNLIIILIAVVVLVGGALTGVLLLTRSGQQNAGAPPAAPAQSSAPPPIATSPTSPTSPTLPTQPTTAPTAPTPPTTQPGFAYQPLWPFATAADAAAWQQAYRTGGHQPWHLDAGLTALAFTQGYLGYTTIDTVVGVAASGPDDWVSVGFANPNGQPVTAAALHLARLGAGSDAPWEVVGTRDTTLSLTTPAYGATVRSPVTVGGRITGVDENLRVQVRQLGRENPVGQTAGIPAGGQNTPWTATVGFTASRGSVLTIAVSTGGHIAAVERFAITGVRY